MLESNLFLLRSKWSIYTSLLEPNWRCFWPFLKGGQGDVSMVAIGWLLEAACCQCDGHRVAGLNAELIFQQLGWLIVSLANN